MERGEYVYSPFRVPSSLSLFDEQQPSVLDSPHFIGNGRHLAGMDHDDDVLAFIAGEGGKNPQNLRFGVAVQIPRRLLWTVV